MQKRRRALPLVLAFAATLPFALFFTTLVARYWHYFDMGVNNAANGLVLLFLYGPGALLIMLAITSVVVIALRRSSVGGWLMFAAALAALVLSVMTLFAVEAHRTRDYPGLRQQKSMLEFFAWFAQSWLAPEPTRPISNAAERE